MATYNYAAVIRTAQKGMGISELDVEKLLADLLLRGFIAYDVKTHGIVTQKELSEWPVADKDLWLKLRGDESGQEGADMENNAVCPRCGHAWVRRVKLPRKCPKCGIAIGGK